MLNLAAGQGQIRRPRRSRMVACCTVYEPAAQLRKPWDEEFSDLPAGETLAAAEMIQTWLVLLDQFPQRSGDRTGRERTAELVGIQRDVLSSFGGPAHVFDEAPIAML